MCWVFDAFPDLSSVIAEHGTPRFVLHSETADPDGLAQWQRTAAERRGEIVFCVRRANGGLLLHTKRHYPAGTFRLLSGGIQHGESLSAALAREGKEELGWRPRVVRFLAVLAYHWMLADTAVRFASFVLVVESSGADAFQSPSPQDETEGISGFRTVSIRNLKEVANQLASLPLGIADTSAFSEGDWGRWGRFRAIVHRLVHETLAEDDLDALS